MTAKQPAIMRIGVLVVSDRASRDASYDKSGPVISQWIQENWQGRACVEEFAIIADDQTAIEHLLRGWCDVVQLDLILTSGGTGFGQRDRTPEAVNSILHRHAPGLTHLILQHSIAEITPFAALSRPVAGIRGHCVILTLPGSPKACRENLDIVGVVLPHAVQLASTVSQEISNQIQHPPASSLSNLQPETIPLPLPTGCSCSRKESDKENVSLRPRESPFQMVSCEKAWELIELESKRNPMPSIECTVKSLWDSAVFAESVYSEVNVPSADCSFLDGYAIRLDSAFTTTQSYCDFKVIGRAVAGQEFRISESPYEEELCAGEAVRINTGAHIPLGANTIIMVEDTELVETDNLGMEKMVRVRNPAQCIRLGNGIRKCGSDLKCGDLLFAKNESFRRGGEDLALLISGCVRRVKVFKRPKIGVLSTGDEIQDIQDYDWDDSNNRICDSNRPALLQLFERYSCELIDLGIVPDDKDLIAQQFNRAIVTEQCDIIITSGGVSMGERDYIKPVLIDRFAASIHFGRIHMKPGKPTTFATIKAPADNRTVAVFGLPGNPVSALVTAHLFVAPYILQVNQHPLQLYSQRIVKVTLKQSWKLDSRPEFVRARIDRIFSHDGYYTFEAVPTGLQTSSRLMSMKGFDGLLVLPASTETVTELPAGSEVEAILIDI